MGFIEMLNKFGEKKPVQKTELYQNIEAAKLSLEAMGVTVKIKNEFDLFEFEIIYRGMLTQNMIENAYEIFLNQNYDLLDYLNYDEKQKMFNNDIQEILEKAPHFYDEQSQTSIYIPYLEPFVNKRYCIDYQLMLLKQHRDYVRNFKVEQKSPFLMYGQSIFRTSFSSLQNVYEDQRHICMYYDQLKTIYIFNKDNNELLNKMIIKDAESMAEVLLEDVKKIAYFIENYLYKECLEFMKDKALIGQKTYQKVLKKYK